MDNLKKEVSSNFEKFSSGWPLELEKVAKELRSESGKFAMSYSRLVSLQAWRNEVIAKTASEESLGFFAEAQNDALVSHVFASMGAWRSALKSLRSCIENVCY